ncbi:hypothetical protein SALBM311S_09552 [Streptomyces alboniger]
MKSVNWANGSAALPETRLTDARIRGNPPGFPALYSEPSGATIRTSRSPSVATCQWLSIRRDVHMIFPVLASIPPSP